MNFNLLSAVIVVKSLMLRCRWK